jgi:hypothetical protein
MAKVKSKNLEYPCLSKEKQKQIAEIWSRGNNVVCWGTLDHIIVWRLMRENEYLENKALGRPDSFDVFDNYTGPGFKGLIDNAKSKKT